MDNIAVIGSGTMGNGIAHVFAQNGHRVTLIDQQQAALDRARTTILKNLERQIAKGTLPAGADQETLGRLTFTTDISAASSARLVVEAIIESLPAKTALFKSLDEITGPDAILASNTSSIPITALGAATGRADRVIGMHFMNPVPIMKLVEVIEGMATSPETTAYVMQSCEQLGKTPVQTRDFPGFISNRVLMPMINEAIEALFQGVAGVSQIDDIMRLGMAHPMGPLQLADFIGLDVCHNILRVLHEGFGQAKYAPCPLLVSMVQAGYLGAKSGRGFYHWQGGKASGVAYSH